MIQNLLDAVPHDITSALAESPGQSLNPLGLMIFLEGLNQDGPERCTTSRRAAAILQNLVSCSRLLLIAPTPHGGLHEQNLLAGAAARSQTAAVPGTSGCCARRWLCGRWRTGCSRQCAPWHAHRPHSLCPPATMISQGLIIARAADTASQDAAWEPPCSKSDRKGTEIICRGPNVPFHQQAGC